MRGSLRWITVALTCLSLSACGFQLRGQYQLPAVLNPVVLDMAKGTLERDLSAAIQRAGGRVASEAPLHLHVEQERINRQTSTIDSRAKAAEYTLFYELDYQLRHASGIAAEPVRSIRLRRTYQFDNTRIVGKYEEENTLIDELRQQAVAQILSRLARVQSSQLTPDMPAPDAAAPVTSTQAPAAPERFSPAAP